MKSVEIRSYTMMEIHQAAYITCRGWVCSEYEENQWTKEGLAHDIVVHVWRGDHDSQETVRTLMWDLEDAYWHQRELDESSKSI
jgi:hypothetical protein